MRGENESVSQWNFLLRRLNRYRIRSVGIVSKSIRFALCFLTVWGVINGQLLHSFRRLRAIQSMKLQQSVTKWIVEDPDEQPFSKKEENTDTDRFTNSSEWNRLRAFDMKATEHFTNCKLPLRPLQFNIHWLVYCVSQVYLWAIALCPAKRRRWTAEASRQLIGFSVVGSSKKYRNCHHFRHDSVNTFLNKFGISDDNRRWMLTMLSMMSSIGRPEG